MVRRYPHKATVIISSVSIVHGELEGIDESEIIVQGSYFSANSGNQVKKNSSGDDVVIHGEFSTLSRPIEGASRIQIESIGLDVPVICWERFQTHSVIYV